MHSRCTAVMAKAVMAGLVMPEASTTPANKMRAATGGTNHMSEPSAIKISVSKAARRVSRPSLTAKSFTAAPRRMPGG